MLTDANTVVDSSPAAEETQDSGFDLESLTAEQDTHWRLTGELPEAKPAEIATQPPKTNEAPDESGKPKGNQEAGKGKGIKERIPQLDSEIQELEARLARKADLKRQLGTETGDKTVPPPVSDTKPAELEPPKRPKMADYNGPDAWEQFEDAKLDYAEKMADYKAAVAVRGDRKLRAEEAQKQQQETERKTRLEKWNKQLDSAVKAHSDWDDVVGSISEMVREPKFSAGADFLIDSDQGAEVLHHLGSNPDEAKQIAAMSPIKQVAALAVIAHSLTKPASPQKPPGPKKVTETPPPPTELSGRNQMPVDPVAAALDADDTETYIREMNAKELAAIAAGRRR